MKHKEHPVKDMTTQQLAQRFVELEWPNLYHPLRANLVDEIVARLQSGHVTRDQIEAMIQQQEQEHQDEQTNSRTC
jgi:hypothetical protein